MYSDSLVVDDQSEAIWAYDFNPQSEESGVKQLRNKQRFL